MNLIKEYELKYIDLEELKLRIDGVVCDTLEDEVGIDALAFYVQLCYEYHKCLYHIRKYGGEKDGNTKRNCIQNQNTEDDPFTDLF